MARVVLEGICKTYSSGREVVQAVRDLHLEIQDGELMALLGPSGCGKTSTLRMIAGLEEITAGRIWIGDRVVNDLGPDQRNVAMAFETYALYPHMTVRDNLMFCLEARGLSPAERRARAEAIAAVLEISDLLDRYPHQLSGGQQQRVSLARALIRQPTVFLLDEPFSHLDAHLRFRARTEIKRIHQQLGTTMILVTHDQIEALAVADRIAVMNFGVLQQVGTRHDLYDGPANQFVAGFVGDPPINFLTCQIVQREGDPVLVPVDQLNLPDGAATEEPWELQPPPAARGILAGYPERAVVVGIRPQHLRTAGSPGTRSLRGRVAVYEFLGEYGLVTIESRGSRVVGMVDAESAYEVGQPLDLYYDPGRLLLFDKRTGRNLLRAQ